MVFAHDWFVWALLSAVFAALTAIFAKLGLAGIDADFATSERIVNAWQVLHLRSSLRTSRRAVIGHFRTIVPATLDTRARELTRHRLQRGTFGVDRADGSWQNQPCQSALSLL